MRVENVTERLPGVPAARPERALGPASRAVPGPLAVAGPTGEAMSARMHSKKMAVASRASARESARSANQPCVGVTKYGARSPLAAIDVPDAHSLVFSFAKGVCMPSVLSSSLAFLAVAFTLAADIRFLSTWKSPDAATTTFVGKKVATLVISQDDGLRVSGEEALARELGARGINAVASYRIVPKPELASAERAKPWFEKAAVEGVVAIRPISKDKVREYTPATWTESYYSSFWNYYGYGWGVYYSPGVDRVDTVVVVETLMFNMASNGLVWASVTETTNPKELQSFISDLARATIKEMHKQGLAKAQKK